MKLFLVTGEKKELIKIEESKNYEKNSILILDCQNCNTQIKIPLYQSQNATNVLMTLNLSHPNKQGYSLEFVRKIARLFSLKEEVYQRTGIHSFRAKTPHGDYKGFVEFIECVKCSQKYAICLAFYGDYSRYPGANIHLCGIVKIDDKKIIKELSQNSGK